MITDEDLPSPKPTLGASSPLDRLGVEELQSYIAGLRAEIGRAEAEVMRKQTMLRAAHSVFKTP